MIRPFLYGMTGGLSVGLMVGYLLSPAGREFRQKLSYQGMKALADIEDFFRPVINDGEPADRVLRGLSQKDRQNVSVLLNEVDAIINRLKNKEPS